ncbi:hypothetical protein DESC_780020 [Desulfosarcina cetonica]|nr:hypothetical protein DESC_780020 [Desulfosarcina cetonica]
MNVLPARAIWTICPLTWQPSKRCSMISLSLWWLDSALLATVCRLADTDLIKDDAFFYDRL